MPTSHYKNVAPVMSILDKVPNITSILDIGCGFGKYGFLFREHLDIRKRRYDKSNWKIRIDAVEIWPEYITSLHRYIYSCIFICDIITAAKLCNDYDLVLLIDVLEHMNKKKGKRALSILTEKVKRAIVISIPETFKPGACSSWPNPNEEHRCLWTYDDLKEVAPNTKQLTKTVFQIIK